MSDEEERFRLVNGKIFDCIYETPERVTKKAIIEILNEWRKGEHQNQVKQLKAENEQKDALIESLKKDGKHYGCYHCGSVSAVKQYRCHNCDGHAVLADKMKVWNDIRVEELEAELAKVLIESEKDIKVKRVQIEILNEVVELGDYRMGKTGQMAGAHYGELKKMIKALDNDTI